MIRYNYISKAEQLIALNKKTSYVLSWYSTPPLSSPDPDRPGTTRLRRDHEPSRSHTRHDYSFPLSYRFILKLIRSSLIWYIYTGCCPMFISPPYFLSSLNTLMPVTSMRPRRIFPKAYYSHMQSVILMRTKSPGHNATQGMRGLISSCADLTSGYVCGCISVFTFDSPSRRLRAVTLTRITGDTRLL